MDYEVSLKQTINDSFIQYAGAVIQSRALTDVRDCIKPSTRQIYYSMYTDGFVSDKPFKKTLKAIASAFRFYLHGDASCEGVIMRSAQPFSMRYPLVEVEGSYGNITETGNWAAPRYTASRLSPLANYLLQDTDKYTIDEWVDNYDDTEKYPRVLSSLGFYNIVNGSFGIAVGLASSIPQFNLREVNNALIALLQNPDIAEDDIICVPDFATGGKIINKDEVIQGLKKGSGKTCVIQAKIDYDKKDNCLIVSELPFGVYTKTICNEIEKLVQKNENIGIIRLNDLTGEQVCIKIYLSKTANPQDMIDYLYQNTSLQSSYSINMTMLKDGRFPTVFSWKQALQEHLSHEKHVYTKKFEHQLEDLRFKLKIVEGIIKAIENLDAVVKTIKESPSTKEANSALQNLLFIDEDQAKAILDMRLSRLTKLEVKDYQDKRDNLNAEIKRIEAILADSKLLDNEIIKKLKEVADKFGDERRTIVVQEEQAVKPKAKKIVPVEDVVVCYTENGYIKSIPASKYRAVEGNLGGIKTTTAGYIEIYNTSKVYRLKVGNIKQCLASEKGVALGTILGTGLTHINMICASGDDVDVVAVTKNGRIKKFNTSLFNGTTQNIKGQDYFPKNDVLCLEPAKGNFITFITKEGASLSCDVSSMKNSGKASAGRVGVKLDPQDEVEYIKIADKPLAQLGSLGNKAKHNV